MPESSEALLHGLDILFGLGLPGVVIVVLLATCWKLFNLYVDSQEKRIEEARMYEAAIRDNTQATQTTAETLNRLIERGMTP